MAINYTYSITKLWASPEEINGFSDVVLNIFFDITATDSETSNTGIFNGSWNISPPPENSENYTPFSSLTQSQIISWLHTSLGEARESMEAQARASITVAETALPWATE